jgi:hypothetical protein
VLFPCIPAGGVPEGWVVFPFISAGGVPDGVAAAEPDDTAACWAGVVSTCAGADDAPVVEDADVLPASCVQPAMKIPATRIADAMIMMIVLFFMRLRVSLSFVVNTGWMKWAVDPSPWDRFRCDHPVSESSWTLLYLAYEQGAIMSRVRH